MPPYSQESALASQTPLPPPKKPEVAAGVANLGNTCYMNAVLQALAHCSELNMAMEMQPHSATCPVARSMNPDDYARGTRKSTRNGSSKSPPRDDYCALCELEHILHQLHSTTAEPVAPTAFVNGFIHHVAPWFKLGVQEDSHEFLRLLIDAMQTSCTKARSFTSSSSQEKEYPFQLFCGTVESNVQCESCHATSKTIDPIEDIGLDVSSKTTSYGISAPPALADVASAFSRFKAQEHLEGYKCEQCGKTGRATKQSRLASIPPILTLHLKRFRYGTTYTEEAASRRRSEISQLLSRDGSTAISGKSGSAKLEGHVKFEHIFDLKPFLTDALQQEHKSMFCRIFAVIVHAGANSHSGHYIAYVRNLQKNEWWKMDDARVTRATKEEVMAAEAYMLFYRVVEHPIITRLQKQYKEFEARLAESAENVEKKQQAAAAATGKQSTTEPSDKKRKREMPDFLNGEEWAANKTRLSPTLLSLLRRGQEFVADNTELDPKLFALIEEAAMKERGVPTNLGEFNVQGGFDKFYSPLRDLLFKIYETNPTKFFKTEKSDDSSKQPTLVAPPVVDANEALL